MLNSFWLTKWQEVHDEITAYWFDIFWKIPNSSKIFIHAELEQ